MTTLFKYPHTPHLSFSPGIHSDDKYIKSMNGFVGEEVVLTLKMDGENSNLYRDHFHARSLDSRNHPSRNWLKAFHGQIAYLIPEGWKISGENMYAKHSIAYDDLESYFYGFGVWDEHCNLISFDSQLKLFEEIGIIQAPILYRGKFNLAEIKKVISQLDLEKQEGGVLRVTGCIQSYEFDQKVAKWVRPGHVQTDEHWAHQAIVPNKLRKS